MTLRGKGYYIWKIPNCENGDPAAIANVAAQAGLSHVLIKIADGVGSYNVDLTTGVDLVPPVYRRCAPDLSKFGDGTISTVMIL